MSMTVQVNYFAILVAGLVAFAIGALWYSPVLFARQWVAAQNLSPEQLAAMQKGAGKGYAVSAVCFLVIALALAMLMARLGLTGVVPGIKLGVAVFGGFFATLGLIANMYSDKKISLYIIDAGYQLVYLVVMGAILGAWK